MNGLFGIGPGEMLLIAVLALIFIGPQRLPGVIQQVMNIFRELRGYAEDIRNELEPQFQEMRQELEGVTREMTDAARDLTDNVNQVAQDAAASTNAIATETHAALDIRPAVNELMAPPPPRDATAALPTTAAVSVNGASHDDEDERPAFTDYRPG